MERLKLANRNLKEILNLVAQVLAQGKVIVVPTDTVYGLVADAGNEEAVAKLFKIKRRSRYKPVGVFVSGIGMAKELAEISPEQEKILNRHWPGAVTFVLKLKPEVKFSDFIAPAGTIGLRQPKHEFLLQLLKNFGKPLAQSSANISEQPAATKIKEVLNYFEAVPYQPDLIIDGGDLLDALPSTVIDLTTLPPKMLRQGQSTSILQSMKL